MVSDGRRVAAPRPRKRKFWKPVGGWGKTRVPFWAYHWKNGDTETVEGVKYTFDAAAADKVCRFFETYLRHFEGEHKGKRFILEPWQRCVARCLFGWKEADSGLRRFRRAFIFVPRKNGKSYFAAGIALYLTMADGESGAQVYSAASDRTQAAIVFNFGKEMVTMERRLSSRCKVYKRSIAVPETVSRYVVLASDAKRQHGHNSHGAIVDELHAHENRELYDVLASSMISRKQPLFIVTTTAGHDRNHICYEQYVYAKRVADGDATDPSYLPVIFEADEKDDWHDPKVWRRVNPNYGVSIEDRLYRDEYRHACEIPGYENTFKRLHLNLWTEQASRWLPMDIWRECPGPPRDDAWWEGLRGRECYVGIDLSSVRDLTAMVGVIPDEKRESFDIICKCWVPADTADIRARRDKVDYLKWAREGHIELTAGASTDQGAIMVGLDKWSDRFRIMDVAVDPWNGERLILELEDLGYQSLKHQQGYASMSGPSKALERRLLQRQLRHGGHPVLEWCAKNTSILTDPAGNIKPAKDKSADRIDLIVALVMALGRAILPPTGTSVYDRRGGGFQSI